MRDDDRPGEPYTRTPLVKRLPSGGSIVLALVLAGVFGDSVWTRLLIAAGTFVACLVILHFVFRQPIERLLGYMEFSGRKRPAALGGSPEKPSHH
jgi:hypothetical protein